MSVFRRNDIFASLTTHLVLTLYPRESFNNAVPFHRLQTSVIALVMAPSRSNARAGPRRPVRQSRTQVQTYHEESSSETELDPQDEFNDGTSRRASVSLRPRETARSYREDSTDTNWGDVPDDSDSGSYDVVPADLPTQMVYARPQSVPDLGSQAMNSNPTPQPTRRTAQRQSTKAKRPRQQPKGLGQPLKKRQKVDASQEVFVGSGVIPPWQTLPYQVLFDIFLRASYPLLNEQMLTRTDSVKWLVNVAMLCRAFLEPALAALYHCPPLLPTYKSHGLLKLLSMPAEAWSVNYAAKVKELHVDVEQVLLYKSGPALGYFDLPQLIEKTPQVQTLRLYHKDDYTVGIPPWNINLSRWSYSDSLFAAIDRSGLILRSWDWNARFLPTQELIPFMLEKHLQPAFQSLKEVRLLHFGDIERDDLVAQESALATALQELPQIERLDLIECTLVKDTLLPQLPSTISSLTLSNCDRVYSKYFLAFLKSHGEHLRELNLSHNRHLNMSFSTELAQCCPNLKKFKMDISIHDISSYHDTEPHFHDLIEESEIPTWPETLQEIELVQLRRLNSVTAEAFFMSLIDAAPSLQNLRRLVVSAILQINWRDRANFRERWISRLEKTFLRRSPPPDPNLRSLRKRPLKPSQTAAAETGAVDEPGRPSTAGSDPPTPSKRHSSRLAQRKVSEIIEADMSPVASSSQPGEEQLQGMCDVVSIRIDNQRPTEMQFNENDFLDDEPSDDSDWDGDDYEPGGGHAW